MIFEPNLPESEACPLLYLRQRELSRSRDLLNLWYFEKWRKGGLHSPLCLWAQLFKAFSAIGTVFELAAVCLLSEPFSAVPTFHYRCNTHTRSFTSPFFIDTISSVSLETGTLLRLVSLQSTR